MHAQKILAEVQKPFLKTGLPKFRPGDTVRVHVKVVEGESERIQNFEGVVLRKQGSGLAQAFTVCDQYFCSVLGPTAPNRLSWMTGTIDPDGICGGPITGSIRNTPAYSRGRLYLRTHLEMAIVQTPQAP